MVFLMTDTENDTPGEIPGLDNLEPEAMHYLHSHFRKFDIPAGSVVFHPGKSCSDFLWLVKGCLRVQMVGTSGREIVLYRVNPGDTCIMTTSCILSGDSYNAEAIVEENITAIAVSRNVFNYLVAISPQFRKSVFASFGNRIAELLNYIEEMAFGRLDQRLAAFICENSSNNQISITHETLARELATHREVISRLLKEIERKGWIKLGHGKIHLKNIEALASIKRRD